MVLTGKWLELVLLSERGAEKTVILASILSMVERRLAELSQDGPAPMMNLGLQAWNKPCEMLCNLMMLSLQPTFVKNTQNDTKHLTSKHWVRSGAVQVYTSGHWVGSWSAAAPWMFPNIWRSWWHLTAKPSPLSPFPCGRHWIKHWPTPTFGLFSKPYPQLCIGAFACQWMNEWVSECWI